MTVRALALLTVLALLLAPAAAVAQNDPFGPIPQAPPEEQAPPPDEEEDDDGGTLTVRGTLALAGGALLLVVGLGVFILRDARRRAPVKPGQPVTGEVTAGRHPGSRPPKQQRKQRSRAKARAARQARKRAR